MKFLLTLKSWQIFLLIWGIPFLTIFIPLENMNYLIVGELSTFLGIMLFLWIYSISKYLPEKLDENIFISKKGFQIHLWYLIAIIFILFSSILFKELLEQYYILFLILVLYYFVAVIVVFKYVSKLLASLELNKLAKVSDYLGYFFMFWFSPVGIWIIQPKVRKYFIN
jgi:hypothetical protein